MNAGEAQAKAVDAVDDDLASDARGVGRAPCLSRPATRTSVELAVARRASSTTTHPHPPPSSRLLTLFQLYSAWRPKLASILALFPYDKGHLADALARCPPLGCDAPVRPSLPLDVVAPSISHEQRLT